MKNSLKTLNALVMRGFRIFISNKAGVFFSLLSPLIILMLYFLFLGDIQVDSIKATLQGIPVDEKIIEGYVNGWMIAGVMAVSCITVSFSAQHLMVADKETGVIADMYVSPVKKSILTLSYLICNMFITFVICFIVLIIAFIFLAISGWYLTFLDVLQTIAITIISVISSSLLCTMISSLIKTASVHEATTGIMSAAIGFLIGAYMPISMFPKALQYFILFVPGTYPAGVYRNIFTKEVGKKFAEISPELLEGINKAFAMDLNFFGKSLNVNYMWILSIAIVALLAIVYAILHVVKYRKK